MAAERSFPESGVLDHGDRFWLEAMADAVLILVASGWSPPARQRFRLEYANAAAAELGATTGRAPPTRVTARIPDF